LLAAVFDVDGTLLDVSERVKRCYAESGGSDGAFWGCFLSGRYLDLDKPNLEVVEHARRLKNSGVRIVVVTGRWETLRERTLSQLAEAGVEPDEVYFRPAGDSRPHHVYKAETVLKLLERGYRLLEVWDDSESVVRELSRALPPSVVIVHYKRGLQPEARRVLREARPVHLQTA